MIYLIDASVYIFRAYYSMPPEMVDRDGHPVNALFGFARMLGDLIERARPKYMAVAFDQSLTTSFRNVIYPAYKAHRDSPPADLVMQMDRCRELCRLLGVASYSSPEYEADDIIGTLLHSMRREGVRATVITRDKDLAQLIGEGDVYWDFGGREPFGYHDIEGRFGVVPERMADFLALMGDSVDNIKGVPGIGAKTAAALMKEFASIDAIYGDLEQVAKMKLRGAAAIGARLKEHRGRRILRASSPASVVTCRGTRRPKIYSGACRIWQASTPSMTSRASARCCESRASAWRSYRLVASSAAGGATAALTQPSDSSSVPALRVTMYADACFR
ncbi:MAG: 5'-3' exonuclease H3TH domain-containing protein [Gammaproteobacteria bacterium]